MLHCWLVKIDRILNYNELAEFGSQSHLRLEYYKSTYYVIYTLYYASKSKRKTGIVRNIHSQSIYQEKTRSRFIQIQRPYLKDKIISSWGKGAKP